MSQISTPKASSNKPRDDDQMFKDIKLRIDYSSAQTIEEYKNRHKPGKDPHYSSPLLNPASQLSEDEYEALRLFLPFFLEQLNENFEGYSPHETNLLLTFCEMIVFHSLILLIS